MCLFCQRNTASLSFSALLAAHAARLWPASSASAPLPPVWLAFFGNPRLFERHVLGIVAGFAGVYGSALFHVLTLTLTSRAGARQLPQPQTAARSAIYGGQDNATPSA